MVDETTAENVTVFERIVASIRAGNYFEQAAAEAGIGRETGYGWLRLGATTFARLHRELITDAELTNHERRCLAFSDAVAKAEAAWEVNANNIMENLARGGFVQTTTTTKVDAGGAVLEVTTKRETLAPNAQVLEWRLQRRYPDRYGQRVDIAGVPGRPVELTMEERARVMADEIRKHKEAAAMGAEAALQVRGIVDGPTCGAVPRDKRGADVVCVREPGHRGRHRYDIAAPPATATVGQPNEEATP